jgi:hypothetical protein
MMVPDDLGKRAARLELRKSEKYWNRKSVSQYLRYWLRVLRPVSTNRSRPLFVDPWIEGTKLCKNVDDTVKNQTGRIELPFRAISEQ